MCLKGLREIGSYPLGDAAGSFFSKKFVLELTYTNTRDKSTVVGEKIRAIDKKMAAWH